MDTQGREKYRTGSWKNIFRKKKESRTTTATVEELKVLKEANTKAEADKITEKDLELWENPEDDMDAEEAGSEN